MNTVSYGQEAKGVKGIRGSYSHIGVAALSTYQANVGYLVPSVRANYEFQNTVTIGFGAYVQAFFRDGVEFSVGIPITWYPYDKLKIIGATGMAYTKTIPYGFEVPKSEAVPTKETTGNFFFGVGAGWDFDIYDYEPRIYVTPNFQIDLINFESIYMSFGVAIEAEFLFLAD